MGRIVKSAFAIVLIAASGQVLVPRAWAQSVDCGADDFACVETDFTRACRDQPRTTRATCSAWLQRLEAHDFADQPAWQIVTALTYYDLADMADSTESARALRQRSRELYERVLAQGTRGFYASEAYLGLATLTADLDTHISLFREAVAADPSRLAVSDQFALTLARRGSRTDLLEAAELLRNSFSGRKNSGRKWYVAAWAVGFYEQAGELDTAQAFRRQVYADSEMGRIADEAARGLLDDPESATAALAEICHTALVSLFGSTTCMSGIDAVARAAEHERDSQRRRLLAEAATTGITTVANAPGIGGTEQERFRAIFEAFIARGIESPRVYVAYSDLLNDRRLAISFMEKAAILAPTDGELLYKLGVAYLGQEMWREAIDSFERARPILPAGLSEELFARQLQRAEAGLEAAGH
jgi:tetratricopeptide (TPR) repeat protein